MIDTASAQQCRLAPPPRNAACLYLRLVLAGLLAVCVAGAAAQFVGASHLFFRPTDSTHPESTIVQNGLWTAVSKHMYRDFNAPPYTPAPYGPAFYAAVAALGWGAGMDRYHTLILGRTFAFTCFAASVIVVAVLTRKLGFPRLVALLAPAALLANVDFLSWSVSVRPDIPAALLSLCGVLLMVLAPESSQKRTLAAGALFGLAVLTKQSQLAAPLAVGVWLLWQGEVRRLLTLLGALLATVGLVVGAVAAHGDPIIQNLLVMRHAVVDPRGAISVLRSEASDNALWLLLGAAGVALALKSRVHVHRLLALWVLFAWALACVGVMQSGGNRNYFLENWMATALVIPFAVERLRGRWRAAMPRAQVALALLLIGLTARTAYHLYADIPARTAPNVLLQEKVADAVKGRSVLSDVPYLSVQSRAPQFLDSYLSDSLEQQGIWSPAPIVAALDQRQYDFVILHLVNGRPDRWRGVSTMSPVIREAVVRNYDLVCNAGSLALFAPKPGNSQLTPAPDLSHLGCKTSAVSVCPDCRPAPQTLNAASRAEP